MTCDDVTPDAVELLAFGEGTPAERAALDAHVAGCDACRARLEEIETIRRAIDGRGVVDAPPGGDWAPFMARLEARLDQADRARARWRPRGTFIVALAATLVLGVALGVWWEHGRRAVPAPQRLGVVAAAGSPVVPQDVAVAAVSVTHLERSKLVLLGLLNKDGSAAGADWTYEQKVAGELLPDTSLYRLAAQRQQLPGLARVLRDLELVLLQASLSDEGDAATLARLQRVIRDRDLLTRIDALADRAAAAPARASRGI